MKTYLLAVCGLTPQVITETLYALHQQDVRVDAIRVLTTRPGHDACLTSLFGTARGHYYRYLEEYGLKREDIDFSFRHVQMVEGPDRIPLEDIAQAEDNEAFLRACLETTFALTSSPEQRVLFSIAGGRKTMGACLSLAAQFYGRPQDRIYHVLVSPEFESNREFFYPPARPRNLRLRDAKGEYFHKNTRYARVTLAPMPFISVRDRIYDELLRKPESPGSLLLSLVRDRPPEMVVDCINRRLSYKEVEMDMRPAHLALYTFFALVKKGASCGERSCRSCRDCYLSLEEILNRQEEIAGIYRQLEPRRTQGEMSNTGILSLSAENFNSYKSRIRTGLERAFGSYEVAHLAIDSQGKRPDTRYGIPLDRGRIKVIR